MKQTTLGIVRHFLTAAGGSLIAKGLISTNLLEEGIGALITLIGVIWSILSKNSKNESN